MMLGIDFFIPNDINFFKLPPFFEGSSIVTIDGKECLLFAQERILIPSGIHVKIPEGFALIFFNKSGIGSKLGLDFLACVTKDTIVETNKGKFSVETLTKEFVKKNEIKIKGYNEKTKEVGFYNFSGFSKTYKKNIIKLIFDDGTILTCSEDHFLYINGEWKKACELDEGLEIKKI